MLDSRWWLLNRGIGLIQHQVFGIGAAEHFASLNARQSISI
jgi:hypothetical protein